DELQALVVSRVPLLVPSDPHGRLQRVEPRQNIHRASLADISERALLRPRVGKPKLETTALGGAFPTSAHGALEREIAARGELPLKLKAQPLVKFVEPRSLGFHVRSGCVSAGQTREDHRRGGSSDQAQSHRPRAAY